MFFVLKISLVNIRQNVNVKSVELENKAIGKAMTAEFRQMKQAPGCLAGRASQGCIASSAWSS